ncbi:MAG: hypothetical protein P0S95_00145 [Rhabdochlamydiaceae bacterium]|nr:hypothetical protein [Candidatus Amphrikana amoebophyrae]
MASAVRSATGTTGAYAIKRDTSLSALEATAAKVSRIKDRLLTLTESATNVELSRSDFIDFNINVSAIYGRC